MYLLKTFNSFCDFGHTNRLQLVKKFYLWYCLQNEYLNEAQFNSACVGWYPACHLP